MNIYIITGEPFPNGMAATNRIRAYSKGIINAGLKCEVIIYRRTEKIRDKPKNTIGATRKSETPFRYIGGTPIRHSNKLIRYYHDILDKWNTIKYIKKYVKSSDVIITYMREDPFCESIIKVCHSIGARVVRDLCEYPYSTFKENESIYNDSLRYLSKVFPKFDGAICISQSLFDVALKYKSDNSKLIKVPILIDEGDWELSNYKTDKIDVPYFFHSGTLIQQKDGIIEILKAFSMAIKQIHSPVKYLFTGNIDDSRDRIEINETIKNLSLENHIEFVGYLSEHELKMHIKNASGFIICKNDNLQNRYNFSTKLGEYLLSGNPLITTSVGEAKFYLNNNKSAYIIRDCDVKTLSDKIVEIILEPEESKKIGAVGKQVALKHFSCFKQGHILRNYFESLME